MGIFQKQWARVTHKKNSKLQQLLSGY